ncbi:hypothetical protein [Streptomyces sasae]|uniref:hypothetical protein n=1 Tax=Streptomyces sasae TaxID=1266772 RepID=UPI00292F8334|nr:hypothetical protein [Streptomyces sasae]
MSHRPYQGCAVRLDDIVEVQEAVARGEDEQTLGLQRFGCLAARTVVRGRYVS